MYFLKNKFYLHETLKKWMNQNNFFEILKTYKIIK